MRGLSQISTRTFCCSFLLWSQLFLLSGLLLLLSV